MTTVDEARAALDAAATTGVGYIEARDALIAAVRAETDADWHARWVDNFDRRESDAEAKLAALREAVVRFFDAYDRTHLVHDVSYDNVNDEAAALRAALAATPAEDGRDPYDSDPEWQRQAADLDR